MFQTSGAAGAASTTHSYSPASESLRVCVIVLSRVVGGPGARLRRRGAVSVLLRHRLFAWPVKVAAAIIDKAFAKRRDAEAGVGRRRGSGRGTRTRELVRGSVAGAAVARQSAHRLSAGAASTRRCCWRARPPLFGARAEAAQPAGGPRFSETHSSLRVTGPGPLTGPAD